MSVVTCVVCGRQVKRTRAAQKTCLDPKCQRIRYNESAKRNWHLRQSGMVSDPLADAARLVTLGYRQHYAVRGVISPNLRTSRRAVLGESRRFNEREEVLAKLNGYRPCYDGNEPANTGA